MIRIQMFLIECNHDVLIYPKYVYELIQKYKDVYSAYTLQKTIEFQFCLVKTSRGYNISIVNISGLSKILLTRVQN